MLPHVSKQEVKEIIHNCVPCQTIDPAPLRHQPGELQVTENWRRIALDSTHLEGKCYLTVVDCGPSRFIIWRKIRTENAADVVYHMRQIFIERGPVEEILVDNGPAFKSSSFKDMCKEWRVQLVFRCAYPPSWNGIAEWGS